MTHPNTVTPEAALKIGFFYVLCILIAFMSFWYVVLVGGNPFTVQSITSVNETGSTQTAFRPGELVSVRRIVCSERKIGTQYRPFLTSDLGQVIPMLGGVTAYAEGCHQYGYAFIMPALPPGSYTFNSSTIYSVNLVGRDEFFALPGVSLEVKP